MRENRQADYKTVRGLSRGLLLLNLLNKFDGGATVGTLAEFSGLHRTTVRRLLETLQEEGYVRRSRSDDSFRLTLKIRQLSEGFRDEHWISALATPLLGELLREVLWPTDISTLDVDAMVVRETTHRFSRLSFHRAMVGRRLPLLLTASGLTWLAFAPDHERQAMIEILAARPEEEYQLAREPEKLAAILERTRRRATAKTFAAGSRRRKSPPSPYRSAASSGLSAA
jgi:IclR family mhp operon transcriptional activator